MLVYVDETLLFDALWIRLQCFQQRVHQVIAALQGLMIKLFERHYANYE